MNFTKLQGAGNDFVLIDARTSERDWPAIARKMCDRHFGVGADGLLLVLPSKAAALRLRMFNPDGSEAEACGNGLRCFALYSKEHRLVDRDEFAVETMAGIRAVQILGEADVRVAMGIPAFDPADIPVVIEHREQTGMSSVIDYSITVDNMELLINCVSMGNPHAVCFLNDPVADFPLAAIGPKVEHHPMFPNRANFEVAKVINRNEIEARVWERGAGETLACGSGACAIAVVSKVKESSDNPVNIFVPGGKLTVDWNGAGEVLLSGPAEVVFDGVWKD